MEAFSSHFLDNIWNAIKTSRQNRLNLVGYWWLKQSSLDTRDWRNIISFNFDFNRVEVCFVCLDVQFELKHLFSPLCGWFERRASVADSNMLLWVFISWYHLYQTMIQRKQKIDVYRSLLHDCHKLSAAINWVIKT